MTNMAVFKLIINAIMLTLTYIFGSLVFSEIIVTIHKNFFTNKNINKEYFKKLVFLFMFSVDFFVIYLTTLFYVNTHFMEIV